MSSTPRSAAGPCRLTAVRWCSCPSPSFGKASPSGCCSSSPWPRCAASSGCRSRCHRCSGPWTGSCAPGGFDVVNLEFSFLGDCNLRHAPPGERLPPLMVDSHNIDYDLARQYACAGSSLVRRLYAKANWRKLRREELGTYRDADGIYLCSALDERRLLDQVPGARTAVIPNAADVEYYQPRSTDPPPDG